MQASCYSVSSVLGKSKMVKFSRSDKGTPEKLVYVHLDPWGPTQNPSLNGSRYFITFINYCTRKTWVYIFKTKDEALEKFVNLR